MMKNTLRAVLLSSLLPLAANASQELSPWYLGAGVGVNNYEPNCDQKSMKVCGEDDPYAWDIFAGYLFNDYLGVELGYRDLGRAEWTDYSDKFNDVGVKGPTLGLVGFWPLANRWSLSAEAGAINYLIYNDKAHGSEYYSDTDLAPYYGAGVGYNFTDNLKLQAKYRRYEGLDENKWDTLDMDSNYWGLELSYRFGHKAMAAPAAPAPAPVVMAPIDTDKDGVTDDMDLCPDTPMGHKVDGKGCSLYSEMTHNLAIDAKFGNDSAVVKNDSYAEVEKLANFMKRFPHTQVKIEGHASNVGAADYNMMLSQKRADAVAKLLTDKYGIEPSRVTTQGYGVTRPLIPGRSAAANAANRRIEAQITVKETAPLTK
ncbi:OmpA family protein [Shewanella salipaludis]|uniref:OmpA family protein n=1 Tax=Shewanella salipaludis TaxID=2723052 RepID=A0A972G061_9GAMM|nr:OmpA family protein [Shewanella salipaludis]NMH64754.1 OmpA family protein [Shewanella salipaludis]